MGWTVLPFGTVRSYLCESKGIYGRDGSHRLAPAARPSAPVQRNAVLIVIAQRLGKVIILPHWVS